MDNATERLDHLLFHPRLPWPASAALLAGEVGLWWGASRLLTPGARWDTRSWGGLGLALLMVWLAWLAFGLVTHALARRGGQPHALLARSLQGIGNAMALCGAVVVLVGLLTLGLRLDARGFGFLCAWVLLAPCLWLLPAAQVRVVRRVYGVDALQDLVRVLVLTWVIFSALLLLLLLGGWWVQRL